MNERNVSTRTVGSGTSAVTYDVHGDLDPGRTTRAMISAKAKG